MGDMRINKTSLNVEKIRLSSKDLETLRDIVPNDEELIQECKKILAETNKEIYQENYGDLMKKVYDFRCKYIDERINEMSQKAEKLGDKYDPKFNNSVCYVIYDGDENDVDELGLLFNKLWEKYIDLM